MRFYAIKIDNAPAAFNNMTRSGITQVGTPIVAGAQFCSVIDTGMGLGFQNDPSALRVQFHIELKPHHTAAPKSFVRIWGVSLDMLSQASDLKQLGIKVYGGFWGGGAKEYALPLAVKEAAHAGLLISGTILTAMGNWLGNEMTLDLFIASGGGDQTSAADSKPSGGELGGSGSSTSTLSSVRFRGRQRGIGRRPRFLRAPVSPEMFEDNPLAGITGDLQSLINAISNFTAGGWLQTPLNVIHNMLPGMPLDTVIQQTLSTAFPNTNVVSLIKSGLSLAYQDAGFYQTLGQYAGYVKSLSQSIVNGGGGVGGLLSQAGGLAGQLGGVIGGSAGSAISGVGGLASSAGKLASQLGGGSTSDYPGIHIYPVKDMLILYDGSKDFGSVTLEFVDLIGQPTWVGPGQINFQTPMRADIFPSTSVTMPAQALQFIQTSGPNTQAVPGPGSNLPRSLEINFQGSFQVRTVMVIGDSRHPAGTSWMLSVNATGTAAGSGSSPPPGTPSGGELGGSGSSTQSTQRFLARQGRVRQ